MNGRGLFIEGHSPGAAQVFQLNVLKLDSEIFS
jgi:hypothetical protein